jgi:hypothetical protein
MEQLSATLCSAVSQSVNQFCKLVADKYSLSHSELLDLWNSNSDDKVKTTASVAVASVSVAPVVEKKKTKKNVDESKICCYVMKKGKNAGSKCTSKSVDDSEYCKKHKLDSEEKSAEPDDKPPAKSTRSNTKAKSEEKPVPPVIAAVSKPVTTISKNKKTGNYVHPQTGLVIDPATRFAVGREENSELSNTAIIPLTHEDIELCNKYNLKYNLPASLATKSVLSDEPVRPESEDEDVEEEEEVDDE